LVGLRPALRAVYVDRPLRPPFTTIQKFMPEEKGGKAPELSKRRNIIVIADEARHFQPQSRSKTVAKPCPTPTQSDAMPREAPVRAIWRISVVARRAPLQPSG
jgi:hypothetical protein